MRCDDVRRELDALVDGELGRWKAWRMRAHLRDCEGCRAAFGHVARCAADFAVHCRGGLLYGDVHAAGAHRGLLW